MQSNHQILILDFGSQYTQLIARRVREARVYCEIHPYSLAFDEIVAFRPAGIILSGGPASVFAPNAYSVDSKIFELDVPILGICYGMQLIVKLLGGKVVRGEAGEYGQTTIELRSESRLFADFKVGKKLRTWMSHGDRIENLPKNFSIVAASDNSPIAACQDEEKKIYALQFHPEVVHTPEGKKIVSNFLFSICGLSPSWTMQSFINQSVEAIQKQVGNDHVILGVSGGVDSSVTAALLKRAIPKQLTLIFINNGLLRLNEEKKVTEFFRGYDFRYVDASDRFLNVLSGVIDPEEKRKKIGYLFIKIFEEEAQKIPAVKFLGQGTLYPDVIESRSLKGPSATIKSHHNVGGLPEKMNLHLVEPLRELFKDEVRVLGKELGIIDELIFRQPFPGPGLAVRILGEVTQERLDLLRKADHIVVSEIKAAGFYHQVWQSFAVLLPVKTVGVMGDERTYEHLIAIRVVKSEDGMTADWVDLPRDLLARISNRIINEVSGVNRVVYDISSKPPSTIEWE